MESGFLSGESSVGDARAPAVSRIRDDLVEWLNLAKSSLLWWSTGL